MRQSPAPSESYSIDQEINWNAQWIEVVLRVELPFWLMTDNIVVYVEVGGHIFPVSINGETFELHAGGVSDTKRSLIYQGPFKKMEDLSKNVQQLLNDHLDVNVLWRKCKTVLRLITRCNEDVFNRELGQNGLNDKEIRPAPHNARQMYFQELCTAHIPVINKLIQAYRLATYDYFAFEVAPWDVAVWHIDRGGRSVQCILVPYRGWDHRPLMPVRPGERPTFYKLIEGAQLQEEMRTIGTPGELEVLDALNFMERGDYSGAVRRITTAVEVVVEAIVGQEIERAEGEGAAAKFLKATRTNFARRVNKYEALSGRSLGAGLRENLNATRQLRHRIVHGGYRIAAGERGRAQFAVDTGRWTFNWFENNNERRRVRETRIGLRSLGRELTYGIFGSEITPDGVLLSPLSPKLTTSDRPVAIPESSDQRVCVFAMISWRISARRTSLWRWLRAAQQDRERSAKRTLLHE